MTIPSYIQYLLLKEDEKHVNKENIPLDKQIQAVARELYKVYIDAGQFKYKLKDKIKKMRDSGADDTTIEEVQEMGDDQLAKLELAIDEYEMRMVAMAGDNAKLAQMAEVWAGEAKNMAAKKNQEYMENRAKRIEKETLSNSKKENVSGEK